jgi:hypothetical protein
METIRYSPSLNNFYPLDIDYGASTPDDLVEVKYSLFESAMSRPAGHMFKIVDDKVIITPPADEPYEVLRAVYLTSVRATRELILNRLAGIGMGALIGGDADTALFVAMARQQLLDITKCPDVLAATDIDQLHDAVRNAYKSITAVVPESVRAAFNMVDA